MLKYYYFINKQYTMPKVRFSAILGDFSNFFLNSFLLGYFIVEWKECNSD